MKRIFACLLAALMFLTVLPAPAAAQEEEGLVLLPEEAEDAAVPDDAPDTDGEAVRNISEAGDGLNWLVEDGILRITGSGDMRDYAPEDEAPWMKSAGAVTDIELDEEVTGIGAYAFYGLTRLSCIIVPETVVRIGDSAFDREVRILGATGSTAEAFAAENGNPFSALVAAPVISDVSSVAGGVSLSWTAVDHAQRYRIYRKSGDSSWTVLGDTGSSSYLDTTAESGGTYLYSVQCFSEDGTAATSGRSDPGDSATYVSAPVIGSAALTGAGIRITWDAVAGAAKYRVLRKEDGGSWSRLRDTAETSFTDRTAVKGTAYSYTVRCLDADGRPVGAWDAVGTAFFLADTPKVTSVTSGADGMRIKWGAVTGAATYRVFRRTSGGTWEAIADTADTVLIDTDVSDSVTYTYAVQCLDGAGTALSDRDPAGKSGTYHAPSSIISIGAAGGGIRISWREVTGASAYRVYRRAEGGSREWICDTTETFCTDLSAQVGVTYTYFVRSLNAAGAFIHSYDAETTSFALSPAPVLGRVINVLGGVQIDWEPIAGVERYGIYRRTEGGAWERIGETAENSFTDTGTVSGTTYTYTVYCLYSSELLTSSPESSGISITYIAAPSVVGTKNTLSGVVITWQEVTGAAKYRVYRRTEAGEWATIGDTAAMTFTDTTAAAGTVYYYSVCCIDEEGAEVSSRDPSGLRLTCVAWIAMPAITAVSASGGGVTVTWGAVSGAYKYRVYRKTETGTWDAIGDTAGTSYTDRTAAFGTAYSYTVRCYNTSGFFNSDFDPVGKPFTLAATPAVSSVANAYGGVKITWAEVTGGERYRVLRKTGSGSWAVIAETDSLSCTDTTAVHGTAYSYTVRCVTADGVYNSDYDTAGKSITYFAAPVLTCAFNVFNGVRMTWGKVVGAAQYRVYRKTEGDAWRSIADTDVTYFLDTEATSSTEYFYPVCCLDSAGRAISAYDPAGRSNRIVAKKRIYLSPSNQDDNTFITGNANEGEVWNDIAARLVTLLAAYDCDVVISDYDMRLDERAEEANAWGADVYIAMHSNAYVSPNMCWGVEVYYDANKPNSAQRKALAQAFLDELSALFTIRGLRTASNLKDCRLPEMPSVIVECGYRDTVSDCNRILNNKDRIAQMYCNVLVSYLGLMKKT